MICKFRSLFCFTLAHFLVDFSCAWLVFSRTSGDPFFYTGLFLYNFCAFALQMPLGLLADRLRHGGRIASLGCAVLAVPLCVSLPAPGTVLLAGTGNALFHLGGGMTILRQSPGRCAEPGIFVSSGALGIYLGTLAGAGSGGPVWPQTAALACFAVLFLMLPDTFPPAREGSSPPGRHISPLFPFLLLSLVVGIRSFLGLIQTFGWKSRPSLSLRCSCRSFWKYRWSWQNTGFTAGSVRRKSGIRFYLPSAPTVFPTEPACSCCFLF